MDLSCELAHELVVFLALVLGVPDFSSPEPLGCFKPGLLGFMVFRTLGCIFTREGGQEPAQSLSGCSLKGSRLRGQG